MRKLLGIVIEREQDRAAALEKSYRRGRMPLEELLRAIGTNRAAMRVLDTGYAEGVSSWHSGTLGQAIRRIVKVEHPFWPPNADERKRIIEDANRRLSDMDEHDLPRPPRGSGEADFDYAVRVLDA